MYLCLSRIRASVFGSFVVLAQLSNASSVLHLLILFSPLHVSRARIRAIPYKDVSISEAVALAMLLLLMSALVASTQHRGGRAEQ